MAMSEREPVDLLAGLEHPMERLESPRMTRKEKMLKQEVDAYLVSDVRETARLLIGNRAYDIIEAVDLPDAICSGLTFKLRLVQMKGGNCYLMARWKPDRYMRRNTGGLSQKWFLEKELFPPNPQRLFQQQAQQPEEEK